MTDIKNAFQRRITEEEAEFIARNQGYSSYKDKLKKEQAKIRREFEYGPDNLTAQIKSQFPGYSKFKYAPTTLKEIERSFRKKFGLPTISYNAGNQILAKTYRP